MIGAATEPRRLAAHQRLAAALAAAGEDDAALWHSAKGAALGEPALVRPLLRRAGVAMRAGDASGAYDLAFEAGEHTSPGSALHEEAMLTAGRAALSGGWAADARERLAPLRSGTAGLRAEATGAFLLAYTLLHGVVPDPAQLIPAGAAAACDGYRRATALGAVLSAEGGDYGLGARHGCSA